MRSFDTSSKENRVEIAFLLDLYGEMLTDKRREALEYYIQEDLSLSEISEINGISRQGVRDNISEGVRALYKYEEKLGFRKKLADISAAVDEALNGQELCKVKELLADLKKELL